MTQSLIDSTSVPPKYFFEISGISFPDTQSETIPLREVWVIFVPVTLISDNPFLISGISSNITPINFAKISEEPENNLLLSPSGCSISKDLIFSVVNSTVSGEKPVWSESAANSWLLSNSLP